MAQQLPQHDLSRGVLCCVTQKRLSLHALDEEWGGGAQLHCEEGVDLLRSVENYQSATRYHHQQ
jgi:hypothetical protein